MLAFAVLPKLLFHTLPGLVIQNRQKQGASIICLSTDIVQEITPQGASIVYLLIFVQEITPNS